MDKYLLREWHIVLILLFHHVATGIIWAFPGIMIPAMTRSEDMNQTGSLEMEISRDQASWFITLYGVTGIIGFITLPVIMQLYGRRVTNFLMNAIQATGSIIIACSSDISTITIGRGILGLAFPGIIIACVIIAEYTHPKRRGFFIVLKMACGCFGEFLCHSLALTLTWRQIAWCSVLPPILGMVGTLTWQESPAWLAFKGRYKDCVKNFEYLRGTGEDASHEIKELLLAQQKLRTVTDNYGISLIALVKAFRSKEFLKPLLIAGLLSVLIQASGCYFLIPYMIEIMSKITKNISQAYYFSIGADSVQILALVLTTYILKLFKRRTILFCFGAFAIIILGLTCVSSYLEVVDILAVKWLTPLLLISYIFLSKISFVSISVVSKGEIFPLQYRGLGVFVSGTIMAICAAVAFQLTGVMVYSIGVHGMLGVYLVVCLCLLISLFFCMPETKDRTLQDIENDFFKLSFQNRVDEDQITNLVVSGQTVPLEDKS